MSLQTAIETTPEPLDPDAYMTRVRIGRGAWQDGVRNAPDRETAVRWTREMIRTGRIRRQEPA